MSQPDSVTLLWVAFIFFLFLDASWKSSVQNRLNKLEESRGFDNENPRRTQAR
jgi:hypothetical protein